MLNMLAQHGGGPMHVGKVRLSRINWLALLGPHYFARSMWPALLGAHYLARITWLALLGSHYLAWFVCRLFFYGLRYIYLVHIFKRLVAGAQPKHVRLWFGGGGPTKARASVVWCRGPNQNIQPKHAANRVSVIHCYKTVDLKLTSKVI